MEVLTGAYRNVQCQHSDWAAHKKICNLLAACEYSAAEAIEHKHVEGLEWQSRYDSLGASPARIRGLCRS